MANPRTSRRRAGRRLIFIVLLLVAGYFLCYGSPSMLTGGLLLPYATHAPGERTIALTFDDGPDPTYTPQVLRVLAYYRACATFFVLGRHVEDHPELVRDIAAAGHAVGSHGYSHTILRWVRPGAIAAELGQTADAIHHAAGIETELFRHPGGMQGFFLPWMTKAVGWRVIVWSVDPQDYTEPGAREIARRILDEAHPGAIVLLHDGSPDGTESRAHTVEALPMILEELRDRGYRFVCLKQEG
jgi:peptidoglycan/xylan/chitin deacetylase (PgdA/CDA1 family)